MQSHTTIQRSIFVRPFSVLALHIETLLNVKKPLYKLPEAGVHWFRAYRSHHQDVLTLKPSTFDTCFLYTPKWFSDDFNTRGDPRRFTYLQTDNTADTGDYCFIKKEATASQTFDGKNPIVLSDNNLILFNGAKITCHDGIYLATQPSLVSQRSIVQTDRVEPTDFIAERDRGAYTSATCRPDLIFGFSICSQYPSPNIAAAKRLNEVINLARTSHKTALRFVPLKTESIELAVLADASFTSDLDMTSQLVISLP